MRRLIRGTLFAVLAIVPGPAASAAAEPASGARLDGAPGPPFRIAALDSARRFDANRLDLRTTNLGSFPAPGSIGLEYPRGSGRSVIFMAGLWVGAKVSGVPRVTVAEFSSEWRPGRIVGAAPESPDGAHLRSWKVRPAGAWRSPADSARVATSAGGDPLVHGAWFDYVQAHPLSDAPIRPVRLPDPASPGDSAWTMGPDLPGDLALWCAFNDADSPAHTNPAGATPPLGLEVRQTVFGYDTTPGGVVFVRWTLFHRGTAPLDSAYVSFWSDPDLGGAGDDLVGWDPALQMAYAYNATNEDLTYGDRPPAVGIRYLGGTTGAVAGACNRYPHSDPPDAVASYNLMRGLQVDGNEWIDPTTTLPTRFPFAGDPISGGGWLDSHPSDRRMLVSAGPLDLAPGDSATFLFAIVVGGGRSRLDSIALLRCQARLAGDAVAANFAPLFPSRLVLTGASATEAGVGLAWAVEGAQPRPLTVLSHAGDPVDPWPEASDLVGTVAADGTGHLQVLDVPIPSGTRRTYGLFDDCDPLRPVAEVTLTGPVPALVFRVTSPVTTATVRLFLALPQAGPARLEAFSVDGRRRLQRDLGALPAGNAVLALAGTETWPAGLYVFRLTQGGASRTARAVFAR